MIVTPIYLIFCVQKNIYRVMGSFRLFLVTAIPALFLAEGLLLYKKNIGSKAANYIIKKQVEGYAKQKLENLTEKILPKKASDTSFSVSPVLASYKNYNDIIDQLQVWQKEAPSMTELVSYGKTASGTECNYLRVGTKDKPKILVHAGLYGDEEFAILATMNIIEKMLSSYGKNDDVTWVMDNRDIYFVPVASPDTFLKPDKIEGYNPHTSFPYPKRPNNASPSPVKLMISMMNHMKFKAVLNMHTPGESIYPPEICKKEDGDKICTLVKKMTGLNGYKTDRVENAHGSGTDVDWFYSAGAASVQMMWGTKTRQFVEYSDVAPSVDRSLSSILLFMKEGTELDLHPTPLRTIYYYQAE